MGRFDEAAARYGRAIEVDPTSPVAMNSLASLNARNPSLDDPSEHFNDKFRSLPTTVAFLAETRRYTLDEFVFHAFLTNLAAFDTGIAVWHFKRRYDAVRPFSAIRHLYRGRTVTAWGGPGRGTVTDLPGEQWRSYLTTQDHPEYPSGTSAICAAHAQASRRFTGTDSLGL